MANPTWSDERKAEAKLLYIDQNLSSSATALQLGVTRNAVIGIIHRMGLQKTPATEKKPPRPKPYKRARTAREKVQHHKRPPLPVLICGEDIPPLLDSVLDLRPNACAYPYGISNSHQFCGRPRVRGAFCAQHAEICYSSNFFTGALECPLPYKRPD